MTSDDVRHSLSLVESCRAEMLTNAQRANKRAIFYSRTSLASATFLQSLEPLFPRMELEESGAEVGGFQRTLKDLFAGAAGGIAQVLLGQLVPICLLWYLQRIPLHMRYNLLLLACFPYPKR